MSLGKRYKFLGTTFQVITGFAVPTAITDITNASPAVVTTDDTFAVGDVVKITGVVGMEEINDSLYVVQATDAGTITLADVDSTNWGAYESGGTTAKGQYSASCEVTSYTGDSGTTTETSTETNCGRAIDFGATDPGSVSIAYNDAPNDFQEALNESRKSGEQTALKTTLPNGGGVIHDVGVVTQVGNASTAGGVWTGSATIRRTVERVDLAV